MPAFCRHNRFLDRCPICSREAAEKRKAAAPPRATRAARAPAAGRSSAARRTSGTRTPSGVVTRKLARAADDGYRSDLIPGVKATADAERLAACLTVAAARLEFPGPYEPLAETDDAEAATWLAFLLALAGPDRPALQDAVLGVRPGIEDDLGDLGAGREVDAYRAWVARAGSQRAAIEGDPAWAPARRFGRAFERMTFLSRGQRFELLASLGAAGVYALEADALHVELSDATTTAAKRALLAGEWRLLERRAADLAEAAGVPLAALDRALVLWDSTQPVEAPPDAAHARIRAALDLG